MRGKTNNYGDPDMSHCDAGHRWLIGTCGFTRQRSWELCLLLLIAAGPCWADGQMLTAPGVRAFTSGVRVLGESSSDSGLSYFGVWDVKANRAGVYHSRHPSVTLGDLVRAVGSETGESLGLAWVIRDDRTGFKIPWSPQSTATILPGDLVVYHGHQGRIPAGRQGHSGTAGGAEGAHGPAANPAEGDRVQLALVGIEARRPRVMSLPKRHATVASVLELLHQRAEPAPPVRLIRTDPDPRLRRDRMSRPPVQLVDGDVLVFDRKWLDEGGLAIAQANLATEFSDSGPLPHTPAAASDFGPPAAGDPSSNNPSTVYDLAPSDAGPGRFSRREHDLPLLVPSDDSTASGAAHRIDRDAVVAIEKPQVTHSRLPSSLAEAAAPAIGGALSAAITAEHHSSPEPPYFSETTRLVPAPIESVPTAPASAGDGPLESLNPLTIAIGVLALAGLCFALSVVWTRIDRTAQALQQSANSGRTRVDDAVAERQTLDQLIGNSVPVIEEQAPLPDRMDYFGPELGRKRMIIDQPHAMAGPHFAVTAEGVASDAADARRSSRAPVPSAAAAPQQASPSAESPTEVRLSRAAEQIRQRGRRRPSQEPTQSTESTELTEPSSTEPSSTEPSPTEPSPTEPTIAQSNGPEGSLPRVGLLDRVLIAMERERRP